MVQRDGQLVINKVTTVGEVRDDVVMSANLLLSNDCKVKVISNQSSVC